MRKVLALAALAAGLLLGMPSGQAYVGNGPWCAFIDIGTGSILEDCQYRSIEECRPNVLAGNRGTCNPNPRWEGWSRPAEPRRNPGGTMAGATPGRINGSGRPRLQWGRPYGYTNGLAAD